MERRRRTKQTQKFYISNQMEWFTIDFHSNKTKKFPLAKICFACFYSRYSSVLMISVQQLNLVLKFRNALPSGRRHNRHRRWLYHNSLSTNANVSKIPIWFRSLTMSFLHSSTHIIFRFTIYLFISEWYAFDCCRAHNFQIFILYHIWCMLNGCMYICVVHNVKRKIIY